MTKWAMDTAPLPPRNWAGRRQARPRPGLAIGLALVALPHVRATTCSDCDGFERPSSHGLSAGATAGIVVGVIAAAVIAASLLVWTYYRRRIADTASDCSSRSASFEALPHDIDYDTLGLHRPGTLGTVQIKSTDALTTHSGAPIAPPPTLPPLPPPTLPPPDYEQPSHPYLEQRLPSTERPRPSIDGAQHSRSASVARSYIETPQSQIETLRSQSGTPHSQIETLRSQSDRAQRAPRRSTSRRSASRSRRKAAREAQYVAATPDVEKALPTIPSRDPTPRERTILALCARPSPRLREDLLRLLDSPGSETPIEAQVRRILGVPVAGGARFPSPAASVEHAGEKEELSPGAEYEDTERLVEDIRSVFQASQRYSSVNLPPKYERTEGTPAEKTPRYEPPPAPRNRGSKI